MQSRIRSLVPYANHRSIAICEAMLSCWTSGGLTVPALVSRSALIPVPATISVPGFISIPAAICVLTRRALGSRLSLRSRRCRWVCGAPGDK
jgi:hypothetical protein